MPPIRQPSFADVLEDVALAPHEEFVEDEGSSAPVNQDWLFHIFIEAAEAVATPRRPDAYRENASDVFQMPLFDATADEDSIAAELDLPAAKILTILPASVAVSRGATIRTSCIHASQKSRQRG
ncbi:MAG: hypothetical protein WDN29_07175 [Methylovirgula sp.]